MSEKRVIHAEVLQKRISHLKESDVKSLAIQWQSDAKSVMKNFKDTNDYVIIEKFPFHISSHIESICLKISHPKVSKSDDSDDFDMNNLHISSSDDYEMKYYIYQLNYDSVSEEENDDNGDGESMASANHLFLPSFELHGLWESLIFEDQIKDQLLNFVLTSLLFADKKINNKLITWNKVVLLHGPPGTGKTSLCKALAQKLSIRLKDRYKCAQLIEINSHSLFSKWFSESGKLVMRLFQKIREYVESGDQLVFILIDEVESLAHTRKASMNGTEPSDAIRVVNALLTQIDNIKNYPNVVILTTSNITEAIDVAFVDRADIKHFINLPSIEAVYEIYRSCIHELMRTHVVVANTETILHYKQLKHAAAFKDDAFADSNKLWDISKKSVNLSGRTLRKLPFLAFALFHNEVQTEIKLKQFLQCLELAIEKQFKDRSDLKSI